MSRFADATRFGFFVLAAIAIGIAAQAREFHSFNNVIKMEAEVVAYDGKTVRLAMAIGVTRNVPIDSLSAADKEYLNKTYPDGLKPELIKEADQKSKKKSKAGTPSTDKPTGEKGKAGGAMEKPSIKTDLVGVTISKPIPNLPADASPVPTGTHILLMVSNPSTSLTGIDNAKSKLSTCEDNKGTDLTEGASGELFEFIPLPDGKSGLVHIHLTQVPVAKSVRATLKGVLHLKSDGEASETIAVPLNHEVTLGL